MAEHLNKRMALMALIALGLHGLTTAQGLADPTRPPDSVFAKPEKGSGQPATQAEPELQSILISPTRRQAIINGRRLEVGDKYGDARVVKITEREVILRNGRDIQTLKLFPAIEKKFGPQQVESTVEGAARKK